MPRFIAPWGDKTAYGSASTKRSNSRIVGWRTSLKDADKFWEYAHLRLSRIIISVRSNDETTITIVRACSWIRINYATRRMFVPKLFVQASSAAKWNDLMMHYLMWAHSCQENTWHYSINSEIMSKRYERSLKSNFIYLLIDVDSLSLTSNLEMEATRRGMHVHVDCKSDIREGCTHPSHLRVTLSFEFISGQYLQGYAVYLARFRERKFHLQDFNRGFYTTFMVEIKNASRGPTWRDYVLLRRYARKNLLKLHRKKK